MKKFLERQMEGIEKDLKRIKENVLRKENRLNRLVREVELLGMYSDCLLRLATHNYMGN